jgi:hypothetical protein
MRKESGTTDDASAPRPLRTAAPQLPAPLHEVNERCLDLIALVSKMDPEDAPLAMVGPLRSLLRGTRPIVRRRAARQPFALVDMDFRDAEWWRAVASNPAHIWKDRTWRNPSPKRAAVQLTQATLMLAWHMTRADIEATSVVFGMSHEVAQVIAALGLSDIETIADRQFRHVRPRWEQQPEIWRKLLMAAHRDDAEAMRDFVVHALQLLMGEVVPRS